MRTENGFTLVELAIVLMIIGLLIAGILRGQELMNNARIASTIQQIKGYQGAVAAFRDQYGQYPGDLPNATTRVPECTPANRCVGGNGNTIIGTPNTSLVTLQTGTDAPAVETSMFWKHMGLAHLISGVRADGDPADPIFGFTNPTARIGGGFIVNHGNHVNNNGIWLILTNTLTGGSAYNPDGANPLTPIEAMQFDQKMDDGQPDMGDVQAPDDGTCDNNVGPGGTRVYLVHERNTCILVFNIF